MKNKKGLIYVGIIIGLIVILSVMIYMFIKSSNQTSFNSNGFEFGSNSDSNQDVEKIEVKVKASVKRGSDSYSESEYNSKINISDMVFSGNGVKVIENTVKISSTGVYYFTGSNDDGCIVVEAGEDDNVILVFDNVNLTSKTTSPVNIVSANNVYINLKEGSTNTFTDPNNYTFFTGDDNLNGTIFSKCDLFICGKGTIVVNANYQDAIVSKDDLIITNSTVKINSEDDAICGKDCVDIKDANIEIVAKGDAIKSSNDSDSLKGYVIIDGGKISIECGDDGIHAETYLVINSGDINITKSYEGIEGKVIEINGGEISVIASDDGINAVDGSVSQDGKMMMNVSQDAQISINGGKIYIKTDGDSFDSNGTMMQTGGDVTVVGTSNAGNGALDYENAFKITGGRLIVYGAVGMWLNPSTSSTQYSICFSKDGSSGDVIEIKDSSGNTIENITTEKQYGAILVSNNSIKEGEKYTLYVNGSKVSSLEVTSIVTSDLQIWWNNGRTRTRWKTGF